jgi:hypothetical protein
MAIALVLLPMPPPAAHPLHTMGFIRIVGQIIASRHFHLLTNLPREIGVNRLFNPHMHVPMLLVRPRLSTRRGAVPDNVLPVYPVPQTAHLDRHTLTPAMPVLPVVYVVGTAHHLNNRRTHPRLPPVEAVVAFPHPVLLFKSTVRTSPSPQSLVLVHFLFRHSYSPVRCLGSTCANPTSGTAFATVPRHVNSGEAHVT